MAMTVYLWRLSVLALALSVVTTLLSPLERGRTAKATSAASQPNGIREKESQPKTTVAILATIGSRIGGAPASFGLLGYGASGLQPAPHCSSVLVFVPVDPIQNTVCVLVGFALSTLSRRGSPTGRPE